jgi:Hypothetical glycosyl hydrolase family 15
VRLRRPIALLLIVLLVAVGGALALQLDGDQPERSVPSRPPPSGPGPDNLPDPILKLWAAENESLTHAPTHAAALGDARRLDAISALRVTYPGEIDAMRAVNPDLQVYAYVMGTFAWRSQPPGTYPASWYLRDEHGAYVRSVGEWAGHYLIDPGRRGWIRDRVLTCRRFLRESGYDGCMIDVLGSAPLRGSFTSGVPVNPRTGAPWQPADWLAATADLAAAVKRAVAPSLVIGNGLSSGGAYFSEGAPTARLLRDIDGGIAEAWLRGAHSDPRLFPSVLIWRQSVDMLTEAALAGKTVMTLTKVWVETDPSTTRAWYRFALASFLLGTNGSAYFGFSAAREEAPTMPFRTPVRLGAPLDRYRQVDRAYVRRFEGGIVLVNPSDGAVRVPLSGSFVTLDGDGVEDRIVIESHTGEILLREDA